MKQRELVEQVRRRMGDDGTTDQVLRAIDAVLYSLGERIGYANATTVAAALPFRLAGKMRRGAPNPPRSIDEFYQRVARREGVPQSVAVWHSQAVCGALCELLPEQERTQLCSNLWPQLRHADPPLPRAG